LQDAKFGTYTNKIREYFYRSEKSNVASSEETDSQDKDNVEPIRRTVA
jgi:NitT/TauT family transport system ATP-binding protein